MNNVKASFATLKPNHALPAKTAFLNAKATRIVKVISATFEPSNACYVKQKNASRNAHLMTHAPARNATSPLDSVKLAQIRGIVSSSAPPTSNASANCAMSKRTSAFPAPKQITVNDQKNVQIYPTHSLSSIGYIKEATSVTLLDEYACVECLTDEDCPATKKACNTNSSRF
jgi:hypothetical protein